MTVYEMSYTKAMSFVGDIYDHVSDPDMADGLANSFMSGTLTAEEIVEVYDENRA